MLDCKMCNKILAENYFRKVKSSTRGFDIICRVCRDKLMKESRENKLLEDKSNISIQRWCRNCEIFKDISLFDKSTGLHCTVCKEEYSKNKIETIHQTKMSSKKRIRESPKEIPIDKKCSDCGQVKLACEFKECRTVKCGLEAKCNICLEIHNKKVNERKGLRNKERRIVDPWFRLRSIVSSSIRNALHAEGGSKHGASMEKYLPYSIDILKAHIESLFTSEMNWSNLGKFKKNTFRWNLEHILPKNALPYSSMEDENFKICWDLRNLRPLEVSANLVKGDKILDPSLDEETLLLQKELLQIFFPDTYEEIIENFTRGSNLIKKAS